MRCRAQKLPETGSGASSPLPTSRLGHAPGGVQHSQGTQLAPHAKQVPVRGQQVRSVARNLARLDILRGGAEMGRRHLQFLRGVESFGSSLRA